MLTCLQSLCRATRENNEDLVRVEEQFALIMDGSTNLGMYADRPDARWYVQRFSDRFSACFDATDLQGSMLAAMEEVRQEYILCTGVDPVGETAVPSASFGVTFRQGDRVTVGLLGDCMAIVYPRAGVPVRLYQPYVKRLDDKVLSRMVELAAEEGTTPADTVSRPEIRQMLQHHRGLMNTEDGYWIMSFCPEAVAHITVATFDAADVDKILLFTDGFSLLEDEFLQAPPTADLETLYHCIIDTEEADPGFVRYPRFKMHDDAGCILLQV